MSMAIAKTYTTVFSHQKENNLNGIGLKHWAVNQETIITISITF